MESQVWVKVSLFLKELRCEDIKRNSIIHLESCQNSFIVFYSFSNLSIDLTDMLHSKGSYPSGMSLSFILTFLLPS